MFADTDRQLRKLSIYKPMQFQVTQIEFDFDDAWEKKMPPNLQEEVIDETLSTIWEAHDEEDLLDEISACTGWCIKSIDFRHILK